MTPCLHLHVLASGSKGNAAVIEGPEGSLLIDCGIGPRTMAQRAAACGCDLSRIDAALVTHEHSDHVSGLSVFAERHTVALYATAGTIAAREYLSDLPFTIIGRSETFPCCGMAVTAFPTSHDVADPVGFRFAALDEEGCLSDAIGWCTDTGIMTEEAMATLANCRILGIEANHDVTMLRRGGYPAYLKARVGGAGGHLSNDQCAEAIPRLIGKDTETVIALHLSEKNNTPGLCVRTLAEATGAKPFGEGATCRAGKDDGLSERRVPMVSLDVSGDEPTFAAARTPDGRLTIVAAEQRRALFIW